MLLPYLSTGGDRTALRFPDAHLTYNELENLANAVATHLTGHRRVAVWATPSIETCVAVVAAVVAGVPIVPLNPKIGERELDHIVTDSTPELILAASDVDLPARLDALPRLTVGHDAVGQTPVEPDDETPALIIYTSGTTGPPKGVVLPRRAIMSNVDALAEVWGWTSRDVLVHALPLFHVHGLVLGVLGALRIGSPLHHLGRFSPTAVGAELEETGTLFFGVPTMYHRLAAACETDPALGKALGKARLLVSGSAALPVTVHERITAASGQRIVERYGMTETLMISSVRADSVQKPGTVGLPLPGVEVRLVDDTGSEPDGQTVGEIQVRGPNLFLGYLNQPEATVDGWFRTGDMAVRDPDHSLRIVGRRATDLIKSGGYKIGAGEIENALLDHPDVVEAAVTGEPDPDLGERIVAWVVAAGPGDDALAGELADHVARLLAPHKRPRVVRFRTSLPRNEMGKVLKRALNA